MSERPDVFMPLYIGDYLAGTSRLTTELHGAYLLLIMDYWMNGALPDDDRVLASITKMNSDAWSIARASLKHFFSIENGCWKHSRIEHELNVATTKKAENKAKAEKAAAARWGNKNKNASSNATSTPQAVLEECPSPSPSPSNISTLAAARADIPEKPAQAKIKTHVDNFFKDDTYLKTIRTIRPDLEAKAEGLKLNFLVFWREQCPIRDDWLVRWVKWITDEKNNI